MHKNSLISILIIFIVSGCAAPGQVKNQAKNIMGDGPCYNLFTANGMWDYQWDCNDLSARCIFALAKDNNGKQACAFMRHTELQNNSMIVLDGATQTQLESGAVARCENFRKQNNVDSACKVFAKNNEIVWEDFKDRKIEFK